MRLPTTRRGGRRGWRHRRPQSESGRRGPTRHRRAARLSTWRGPCSLRRRVLPALAAGAGRPHLWAASGQRARSGYYLDERSCQRGHPRRSQTACEAAADWRWALHAASSCWPRHGAHERLRAQATPRPQARPRPIWRRRASRHALPILR
eukprot:scaffold1574_cov119-Isochrysis_galbana.AAC.4